MNTAKGSAILAYLRRPDVFLLGLLFSFIFAFFQVNTSYAASFSVTNISPSSGTSAGGDIITVTGANFTAGMTVRLDGNTASNVVVQGNTTLTAQVPAGSSGLVSVSVTNPSNENVLVYDAFTYTNATGIGITSISPTSGPEGGGTSVTVGGSGYAGYVPFSTVKASTSGNFACGIAGGAVYCWGAGGSGRMGDGTASNSYLTPNKVAQEAGMLAGKTVTDVSVGQAHVCAVASGELYCWGNNASGQLGNSGATTTSRTPAKVTQTSGILLGKTVTSVSASSNSTCAIASGEAFCWGSNSSGQLGDNSVIDKNAPVKVSTTGVLAGVTITSISAGVAHSCATGGGEAFCWGNNGSGRLGDNTTNQRIVPVKVTQTSGLLLGKSASQISTGTNYTCAVASGEIFCWGANSGKLGNGGTANSSVPVRVSQEAGVLAGKVATSVQTASTHTCAVADSQAFCWGTNSTNGKLGSGNANNSTVPVAISAGNALFERKVTNLALGSDHTCAVARQNLYCFGENPNGEFGNGTSTSSLTPSVSSITNGSVPLELTIGGTATPILTQTSSQLTATTLASTSGAKNVSVRRTDTSQTATLTNGFQYIGTPTLTATAPNRGSITGGNTITVTGTNFVNGATVRFGSVTAATVSYISDTQLSVVVPGGGTDGSVAVRVTNPDGQYAELANAYTYIPPAPVLTSLNQPRGKMGGNNTVTLTGNNFLTSATPIIYFDSEQASNITVVNSTTVTATVPASSTVKKATVTYTDGYNQSSSLSDAYTYLPQSYIFTSAPLTLMATEPGQMTVQARDPSNQPANVDDQVTLDLTSTAASGYFALTTDESNGDPWSISSVTLAPGSSSVTFYYKDTVKGTPTIKIADILTTNATQNAIINSRYKLDVTGISDPLSAGVPSSATIRAVDYRGLPETSYSGTIRFSSSDQTAKLPGNSAITADMKGVRTFVNGIILKTTGEHCVTVTDISDPAITGQQCNITTTSPPAGSIARLKFITPEQFVTAGKASSAITIQAQDSTGAPVVVAEDTLVYIKSDSASAEFSADDASTWSSQNPVLTIEEGASAATFYYRDSTQLTSNLLAADRSTDTATTDLGLTNDSQAITTGTGEAAKLAIDAPNSLAVHNITPIVVRLTDDNSNTTTTPEAVSLEINSNSQHLLFHTSGGQPIGESTTTIIPAGSSQAVIYISSSELGDVTLTASDTRDVTEQERYEQGSSQISFTAAAPYSVGLTAPASSTVKTSTPLQLQLYDEFGNVTQASSSTPINLSSSDSGSEFRTSPNGTPVNTRAIPSGSSGVTIYYYANTLGDHSISISSDGLLGDSDSIAIQAGQPKSLVVTTQASNLTAGEARQLSFELRDENGYPAAAQEDMSIDLGSSANGEFSLDNIAWNAETLTVPTGSSAGSFYYRNTLSGNATINLSFPQGDINGTFTQPIVAASPQEIHFTSSAQTISRGSVTDPIQVGFSDEFGNETAADSSTVVTFSDNSASGEFSLSSTGPWSSSVEVNVASGALSQTIYYRSSTVGAWDISATAPSYQADTQGVTVTDSQATTVTFVTNESTIVAGQIYPVTLVTTDDQGALAPVNNDTTFTLTSNRAGEFSQDETPFTQTSTTTLNAGESQQQLYYRATETGIARLSASSSGLQSSPEDIAVTPSSTYRFAINPITQSIPINEPSDPYTVTTYDLYGNVSPVDSSTSVYLYTSSSSGVFSDSQPVIPQGSSTQTFTYQDAAFSDEPIELTASDHATLDAPDSDIINGIAEATIISAQPDTVKVELPETSLTAGEYSTPITISLEVTNGDPAYQDGSTSVSLSSSSGGEFYQDSGDQTSISQITIERGEASAVVYYRPTESGAHALSASYGSATGTKLLMVNAAAATNMAIVTPPREVSAGSTSEQIIAKFYDEFSNETVLDSNQNFTLTSSCTTGQFSESNSSWNATETITLVAGSDQLAFYYQDSAPGDCTLTIANPAAGQATQLISITSTPAPTRLKLTLSDNVVETGQTAVITVETTDTAGNVRPVLETTTIYLNSSSQTGVFERNTITLNPGESQAQSSYTDTTPGEATITSKDQSSGGDSGLVDSQATLTIERGEPASIRLIGSDVAQVGEPYRLDIELVNRFNQPAISDDAIDVQLSSNQAGMFSHTSDGPSVDSVVMPANQSSVPVYYTQTVASDTTLAVEPETLPAAQKSIRFEAFNVTNLRLTPSSTAITGERKLHRVELLDEYGNISQISTPITLYLSASSTAVRFYSNASSQDSTETITIPANTSSVNFYTISEETGSFTIAIDDTPTSQPDTGIQQASSTLTVAYGDPSAIQFTETGFEITRGASYGPVEVQLINSADSTVPATELTPITLTANNGGEVALSQNGPWDDKLTTDIPISEKSIEVYVRNNTGTTGTDYSLSASAELNGQSTNTSLTYHVVYGTPSQFAITSPAQSIAANNPSNQFAVELRNSYGARIPASNPTRIYLRSSDVKGEFSASTQGPWGMNYIELATSQEQTAFYYRSSSVGDHTITVADTLPVTPDTGLINDTQNIEIVQQTVTNFAVTNISDPQQAGTPSSVVVIAQDDNGYTVPTYNGTISFSSDDPAAILPDEYTFIPNRDSGSKTFTNGVMFKTVGEKEVRVEDNNDTMGIQTGITVTAANTRPVRSVAFTSPASPHTLSPNIISEPLTIQRLDEFGTPTIGTSNLPIRLVSDSSTGELSTNKNGPWASSLTTSIEGGLTARNVYYRDATISDHTLTVADWIDRVDNTVINNGTLTISINTARLDHRLVTASKGALGTDVTNPYLFAHDDQGAIASSLALNATSRSSQTNLAYPSDWQLELYKEGEMIDSTYSSDTESLEYNVDVESLNNTNNNLSLTLKSSSQQGVLNKTITIPISPWKVTADASWQETNGIMLTATPARSRDTSNLSKVRFSIYQNGSLTQPVSTIETAASGLTATQQWVSNNQPPEGTYVAFVQLLDTANTILAEDISLPFTVGASDSTAASNSLSPSNDSDIPEQTPSTQIPGRQPDSTGPTYDNSTNNNSSKDDRAKPFLEYIFEFPYWLIVLFLAALTALSILLFAYRRQHDK